MVTGWLQGGYLVVHVGGEDVLHALRGLSKLAHGLGEVAHVGLALESLLVELFGHDVKNDGVEVAPAERAVVANALDGRVIGGYRAVTGWLQGGYRVVTGLGPVP